MYLSEITLRVNENIEIHHLLRKSFAKEEGSLNRPFLFRALPRMDGQKSVTILSDSRPADMLSGLRISKLENPEKGMHYIFSIVCSPTKQAGDNKKPQILPLCEGHAVKQWLQRKLESAAILNFCKCNLTYPTHFSVNGQKGIINTAVVTGMLRCEDPGKLSSLMLSGIGRGKSFGCGLLLLYEALVKFQPEPEDEDNGTIRQ